MKSNYKPLGQYLKPVSIRNSKLQITNLIGLSIQKKFIPSISNTIGTDMSTYRILNTNQFAYCSVTSRNGEKITIALYEEKETAMVSQAYDVFEITNAKELLPEYLMMWFRRPEFDRYARFMSHGSVREMFEWEDLCNVELPVPHPDKQKEIVKEYNSIVNRIALNNQFIKKLEETAQAIYKQWFVEFNFPNEKGKPYKSSGGEMMESELGEIPKGWRIESLSSIANYLNGLAMQNFPSETEDFLPVIKIRELSSGNTDEASDRASKNIPKQYLVNNGDIIFSWSGTLKVEIWAGGQGGLNQHLFKVTSHKFEKWFYYLWTNFHLTEFIRIAAGKATSLGHIKREHLDSAKVLVPTDVQLKEMDKLMKPIIDSISNYKTENILLKYFINLLLSKMATIEN